MQISIPEPHQFQQFPVASCKESEKLVITVLSSIFRPLTQSDVAFQCKGSTNKMAYRLR